MIDEPTLELVRKLIDYEASSQKSFYNECAEHGHAGSSVQKIYKSNYNTLFLLREKLTLENLTKNKEAYETYRPAIERIFT